ncbi:MAG: hypothetical protein KME10_02900 [Plectolyngbya sp. WJT66-NPBG17]|jgi:hypothetical protein|nr:hypothetical protein [Plectolyngbya sp. WJT66-NPBG17]MBW4526295.1 hypothetical protein [Phormidium tanganyikae FI6-MK23]
MNALWFRLLRTVYRKEPITGFILTAGAMNVAIGGIDQNTSLVIFGLSTVAIALAVRWWSLSHRPAPVRVTPADRPTRVPVRALPERSSARSLPDLSMPRKPE